MQCIGSVGRSALRGVEDDGKRVDHPDHKVWLVLRQRLALDPGDSTRALQDLLESDAYLGACQLDADAEVLAGAERQVPTNIGAVDVERRRIGEDRVVTVGRSQEQFRS